MKNHLFLILTGLIVFSPFTAKAQEEREVYSININKACAAIVKIPYASDNFSDKQWNEFVNCRRFMKQFIQND